MGEIEVLEAPKIKPATTYQQRLREGRQAAGASLETAAKAMGKTIQYLSQFERGANELTVSQFLAVCTALHLRTEWVLHGTGKMFVGKQPAHMGNRNSRPAKRADT